MPRKDPREIFIYSGAGVAERSRRETPLTVEALLGEAGYEPYLISSSALNDPEWVDKAAALIMPGGADVPYAHSLAGHYNDQIRNYVEHGGKYLGFCAGAYYGSAYVEFDKDGSLEVLAERELKFFPGIARGPAYGTGTFFYENDQGGSAIPLMWCADDRNASQKDQKIDQTVRPIYVYYNGGCVFVDPEKYPNVKVLARYGNIENYPAAIIECNVGKGTAILSGVHPEFSLESLPLSSSNAQEIVSVINKYKNKRLWLLNELFQRLGLQRESLFAVENN